LLATLLMFCDSSNACDQRYLVVDQTTLPLISLTAYNGLSQSPNLLATIVSPGTGHWVMVSGSGQLEFVAVLAGGVVMKGRTTDMCMTTQIVLSGYQMVVN
jgi:hypothetical protein